MAVEIKSGAGSDIATINADKQVLVRTSDDATKAGYAVMATRNDEGAYTGSTSNLNPECNDDYSLRVAVEKFDFQESFAGAALNSAQWSSTVTTMTTSVSGGYLRLNNGNSAAANAVARVTSYRTFNIAQQFPIYLNIPLQIAAASVGVANTTWELGLFIASGTTAPTDGVFLRMNASSELRLVCSYNGTETQSGIIDAAAEIDTGKAMLPVNEDRQVLLEIAAHRVKLWVDDVLIVELEQPEGVPTFSVSQALPLSFRIYNAAVVPASATQLLVGPITISTGGIANGQTFVETMALQGAGAYQGQSGGTMGQTLNWGNSAEPANATLSNVSAGYTTFGGQWAFAAPAGAATDFCLFGFQVPAAAAGSHNKNLLITGIRIDAVNAGAAVATTATILQWAIAVGSTAVSLATTEAATTRAPRRVALGVQSWVVGAAIGASVEAIRMDFGSAPLLAEPGSFVQVICRVPVGTATGSQVIRGTCTPIGKYV